MISKMQFMDSLIGKPVVDALIQTLYNQTEDFPSIYQAYLDAIEKLHAELGPDAKNEIKKYVTAIEQMCASNLYYAGTQGLKMNYDHFVNPMTPNCTWSQVDYDDYLRPYIAESSACGHKMMLPSANDVTPYGVNDVMLRINDVTALP